MFNSTVWLLQHTTSPANLLEQLVFPGGIGEVREACCSRVTRITTTEIIILIEHLLGPRYKAYCFIHLFYSHQNKSLPKPSRRESNLSQSNTAEKWRNQVLNPGGSWIRSRCFEPQVLRVWISIMQAQAAPKTNPIRLPEVGRRHQYFWKFPRWLQSAVKFENQCCQPPLITTTENKEQLDRLRPA